MGLLPRLKKRAEFLCVINAQNAVATRTVVVQISARSSFSVEKNIEHSPVCVPPVRVGFTVSRKVGNAVKRNRARRRLRTAAQQILPQFMLTCHDVVFIGRRATVDADYERLLVDCRNAVRDCLKRMSK